MVFAGRRSSRKICGSGKLRQLNAERCPGKVTLHTSPVVDDESPRQREWSSMKAERNSEAATEAGREDQYARTGTLVDRGKMIASVLSESAEETFRGACHRRAPAWRPWA